MLSPSNSTKANVLVLTLLLSCWRYHATHVYGTTIPTNGGGTNTVPSKNTSFVNHMPSTTTIIIRTNQSTEAKVVPITRSVEATKENSTIGAISIDRSSFSRSFQQRDTAALNSLHADYSVANSLAVLGEEEEDVTGRYYREDGATGSTHKGRKYRNPIKQTYKDGSNTGSDSNNPVVSEPIDQHHPPPAIVMVSHPPTMKGHQFSSSSSANAHKKKGKTDLMSRILPMMIMPFLISTSLIPMMLTSLKFMLLKSVFVGKIAIVLLVINALWRIDNKGGVYSHNVGGYHGYPAGMDKALNMAHYGYNGDEEYAPPRT